MISSNCCVKFQTSVQQKHIYAIAHLAESFLFFPFSFLPALMHKLYLDQDDNFILKWFSTLFLEGARFYSGCGDKVIAAAKASRGGEAAFQSKRWLFVLLLISKPWRGWASPSPVSCPFLRWGGGWGGVFLTD